MKESKHCVRRNGSYTFPSKNKNPNDSNWTSSSKTKAPINESLYQGGNQEQRQSSRFQTAKRNLQLYAGTSKSSSIMRTKYTKNPYQDSNSSLWYMSQKETFQHIQPPSFQNEISNAKGRKEQGLNDVSLEQQANRCRVIANYDVQTMRGRETKELLVVKNNDSNHGAGTFKKCSLSPTPGCFNLNDVHGDLPADFPDFSPLPYEYENANASNNNDGQKTMPHQHCAATGNDAKRQKKAHKMNNTTNIRLPTFPRRSDNVILRKQPYHTTHSAAHHDEQSTPQFLKEERKQQQLEYLPATLNFPYKDFIASHSNKNESQLQLWSDEEEQSRLEKHFNPKWQVEFFSKFYSSGGASLEIPEIFGPSKHSTSEKQEKKDDSTNKNARRNCSISTTTAATQSKDDDEEEEIVFVSMTLNTFDSSLRHVQKKKPKKDHSNAQNETCTSPSSASSGISHHSILLEEAAMKLSAAMDDTDKTRDLIDRIEKEMHVNRDEILRERMPYFVASSNKNRNN